MAIIIDLLLAAIIISTVWAGIRAGLIRSITGVLVILIAIVGANYIARAYSAEFLPAVEPFINSFVDDAVSKIQISEDEQNKADGSENASAELKNADLDEGEIDNEVFSAAVKALQSIGLSKSSAETLAKKACTGITEVGKSLKKAISDELCNTICFLIVFMISFVLILIALTIIATIVNFAFNLPGLNLVNSIGGGAFGLVKGVLIAAAIACVFQYIGFAFPGGTLKDTVLLEFIMGHNPISSLLNI